MPIREFPPHEVADDQGLLALGGDLHVDSLRLAYRNGIFPWPMPGLPLAWFSPPERAVLFLDELHVPRSLARERRRSALRFTVDQAFERVIEACSRVPRPGQEGTWITRPMLRAYVELHRQGDAHSVEAWRGDELVGGIYGVESQGVFAAESMFYLEPYASKLALLELIDRLRAGGATFLDIQMMTPHMEKLGARVISREQFLQILTETHRQDRRIFAPIPPPPAPGST